MDKQILETVEKINKSIVEMRETNEQRIKEIEQKGQATAETVAKLMRIEKELDKLEDIKSQLERLEKANSRKVAFERDVDQQSPEEKQHYEAFMRFMRNPKDGKAARELEDASAKVESLKQVEVTTPTLGGHAVPQVLVNNIERKVIEISPMRRLVNVQRASSTDFKMLVDVGGASSGWVGEKQARSETDTPGLEPVKPTFGMLYAYPKATEESLQDMFFDVAGWLTEAVAEAFAFQEGRAILTGNGTNKPTGMMFPALEEAGDYDTSPARTFGHYQFIKTGVAGDFPASPNEYDVLIDLVYALNARYRQNASWIMNRLTMAKARKIKDADGNYVWQPGVTAGQPSILLGYRVEEVEGMPSFATDAYPIGFGDWKKAYLLVDLVGLRVTPDEITTPGFVKWYFRKRMGGIIHNDDAAKFLKASA